MLGVISAAGADLKAKASDASLVQRRRNAQLGGRMLRAIIDIPQVTIAAVQGARAGRWALYSDGLRFQDCRRHRDWGLSGSVNLGMNLMWQSVGLCTRLVGAARAKRMIMLGERFDAQTLVNWGLWDEAVPEDQLMERALALAKTYAEQPPIAVQMIKQTINQISGALDQAILHMDADQNLLTGSSQDRALAIQGFFGIKAHRIHRGLIELDDHQILIFINGLTFGNQDGFDSAGNGALDRNLHLHGFQDHEF